MESHRAVMLAAADGCPYRRPFPADFHKCPAYQPAMVVPEDLSYEAMGAVWTCEHMGVGVHGQAFSYPRCRLGDEVARRRWAELGRTDRLAEVSDLRRRFALTHAKALTELTRRRRRAFEAPKNGDSTHGSRTMEGAIEDFLSQSRDFFEAEAELLENVGLPSEVCLEIVEAALRQWLASPERTEFDVSAELLARVPEVARPILQPPTRAPRQASAAPARPSAAAARSPRRPSGRNLTEGVSFPH